MGLPLANMIQERGDGESLLTVSISVKQSLFLTFCIFERGDSGQGRLGRRRCIKRERERERQTEGT